VSFEWMTILTVAASGIATWVPIVMGIVKLDRKIFSHQSKLPMIIVVNLVLSGIASSFQFLGLNWVVHLFTGTGFGYAISFAVAACILGALLGAAVATFLFAKGR